MIKLKKPYLLLCIPLLLIILSSNSLFALSCWVESSETSPAVAAAGCNRAQVDGVNGSVIIYFSSITNAHGALATSPDYNNVLCCSVGATASLSCSTGAKILGLSTVTNAHTERPELSSYTNGVCSNGFNDIIATSSAPPGGGYISLTSLSSSSNAHLGRTTDYSIVVYGNATPVGGTGLCDLTSASWQSTERLNGTQVNMNVGGTLECQGQQISFEVFRGSTPCSSIVGCIPPANSAFGTPGTWIATPADDVAYTFTAKVVANPTETQTSSNSLLVTGTPPWCTDGIDPDPVICQQYDTLSRCESNECALTQQQIESSWGENPPVDCGVGGVTCSCWWDTDTSACNPKYTTSGPTLTAVTIEPETAYANIGITTAFTVVATYSSGSSVENPTGISCASSNPSIASKVASSNCSFTANSLGVVTITANYIERGITKEDTSTLNVTSAVLASHILLTPATKTILIGGQQAYSSSVYWSNGSSFLVTSQTIFGSSNALIANFSGNAATGLRAGRVNITGIYNAGGRILNGRAFLRVSTGSIDEDNPGMCFYSADSSDTCEDDNYLSVIWSTVWNGPAGTPEAIQCQNDNGKSDRIACPAQIQLPFFTLGNLIFALIVIALVYWVMESRKGKRKR